MKAKRDEVFQLMRTYCNGSYNRFARELEVDPAHLYRYLNTGVGGGKKIIGAVIRFCRKNQLDFEEYIEI